jgi:hypothetical protein
VVNLKDATYNEINMKQGPDVFSAFTFQLSGSHIAFTNQLPTKKSELVLLHTKTGQTILNYPMADFGTFYFSAEHVRTRNL